MIKKIHIEKFRGFHNVECELGSQITVIAGQNGTQKTVLLGMLSQPFSITDDTNPMKGETPLCGGNYKSQFGDKFKFSPKYDLPKSHEWTIFVDDLDPFTVESIKRDSKSNSIRFWQKGTREKGSGYLQYPVIYLSLKRLFPIGEDDQIKESSKVVLTPQEIEDFKRLHNEILISFDRIEQPQYVESKDKNTLGVNTDQYDWMLNSAGQDNLGKIILALMSFQRLRERYSDNYKGGILAIDELDSALYPASQIKLFEVLRRYASRYNIQIIFTTHSLPLIKKACDVYNECQLHSVSSGQIQILYLEKRDGNILFTNIKSYDTIQNRLNVSLSIHSNPKINVYTEDDEARSFIKNLLPRNLISKLNFLQVNLGCNQLIALVSNKIPAFLIPQSLIILDGDASEEINSKIKWERRGIERNVICLPGACSPERAIAEYLYNLSESDSFWTSVNPDYSRQVCFRDYSLDIIKSDRVKAKAWFNEQSVYWGKMPNKAIRKWKKENEDAVANFVSEVKDIYNKFASELGYDILR